MRCAGRHGCRDKIDLLAQLFRVRPGNAQALSAKSIDNKIGAIRAEVRFRAGFTVDRELATAENVRQTKLLGDGGAKTAAGEAAQFQNWRLANFSVNTSTGVQAQRTAMPLSIEEIVDLTDGENGLSMRNPNFFPRRLAWRSRNKADLVCAKIGHVTARILRSLHKPLNRLRFCHPRFGSQFDIDRCVRRNSPDAIGRLLRSLHREM